MSVTLHQLLKTLVEQGGTDMHITTNSPPQIRVDGNLVPLQLPPLTAPEPREMVAPMRETSVPKEDRI